MRNFLSSLVSKFGKSKTSSLTKNIHGEPVDREIQIAVVAILIEASCSDSDIAHEEADHLLEVIAQDFSLSTEEELVAIIDEALRRRAENPKIDDFVAVINEQYSASQRASLLERVWSIAISDGKVEKGERRLASQLQYRFKLDEETAAAAKKRAVEKKSGPKV